MFTPQWEREGWMRAAEAWAHERGLTIAKWRVDCRFLAGGAWYAVAKDGEAWAITPVPA
jgi:hypothetical protein